MGNIYIVVHWNGTTLEGNKRTCQNTANGRKTKRSWHVVALCRTSVLHVCRNTIVLRSSFLQLMAQDSATTTAL
jgi:hypothetical protein